MKLEIGKRYVRRDGKITAPLRKGQVTSPYPFVDSATGCIYMPDGIYEIGYAPHSCDLVAEYVESPSLETRVTKLEADVAELKEPDETAALRAQLKAFEVHLSDQVSHRDRMIDELRTENMALLNKLGNVELSLSDAKRVNGCHEIGIAQRVKECKTLKDQLRAAEDKNKSLVERVETLTKCNDNQQKQLEALQARPLDIEAENEVKALDELFARHGLFRAYGSSRFDSLLSLSKELRQAYEARAKELVALRDAVKITANNLLQRAR